MKVRNFTTVNFVNLSVDSTIRDAIQAFLENRVDISCITNNKKLVGILHKYSVYRALLQNQPLEAPIKPLINESVVTIDKDQSLLEARDIMIKGNVSQAIVLDNQQEVYGIMSKSDLVNSHMMALEDALNRMKLLMENLQDAVISVDDHLRITTFNQTALDLLQLNGKQLLSAPIDRFLPPFRRWLIETMNTGEIQELKRIHFNQLTVIATFIPIKVQDKMTGAMVVLRDINEYRGELFRIAKDEKPFATVVSINERMEVFKHEAAIAAKSLSNVLITGESGTGKELIAEGIHQLSERKGAFIKINCGAIPEELLESEFFGYADGAFTGAKKGGKPGKFELADNGTLFLDEIGDMPLTLQVKLLRVLQDQEFERIGATKTTKVNVRMVAATNKDLAELVRNGEFREDLYYRIHVIHLHIPPLRERLDDIPLLCSHFIHKFNKKTNKKITGVSQDVLNWLQQYHWPGNIRQLENVLERAFHYSPSNWIDMEHLPSSLTLLHSPEPMPTPPKGFEQNPILNRRNSINQTEKQLILQALIKSKGNRTKAAEILGISRTSLYQKMKKYEIKEEFELKFTST
ncbi:sigma-54-dependent Fis family transcriptional regulator [Neobacillus niacini]|uniref:sigma-54-dependent Fis family transcriptional regulator n=1 Tax=Neobacillus niacini TaxID=86668 RepID=UPI0021CB0FA3|nr:sigma-54-dependent Fis family transcriptional regulator [Neobacillus niacini]MCM3764779.1 sigma 54-interacting transcriptional regulator [Neobacillus niacini]